METNRRFYRKVSSDARKIYSLKNRQGKNRRALYSRYARQTEGEEYREKRQEPSFEGKDSESSYFMLSFRGLSFAASALLFDRDDSRAAAAQL